MSPPSCRVVPSCADPMGQSGDPNTTQTLCRAGWPMNNAVVPVPGQANSGMLRPGRLAPSLDSSGVARGREGLVWSRRRRRRTDTPAGTATRVLKKATLAPALAWESFLPGIRYSHLPALRWRSPTRRWAIRHGAGQDRHRHRLRLVFSSSSSYDPRPFLTIFWLAASFLCRP